MDTDTENEIVTVIDGDSDRPPGGMVWGSFYETVASIKDSLKVTHDIANGLEASITLKHVHQQLYQFLVIIHDQDFPLPTLQGVRGNAIVLHEGKQLIAWNTAKSTPRHAKSLQRTVVTAANNRLLADLTDLGSFARGKNSFCRHGW